MTNAEAVSQDSPEQVETSRPQTPEPPPTDTKTAEGNLEQLTADQQAQPTDELPVEFTDEGPLQSTDEVPLQSTGGASSQPATPNDHATTEHQFVNRGYQEDIEANDISNNNNTTTVIISEPSFTISMVPSLKDYLGLSYSSFRMKGKANAPTDYEFENKGYQEELELSDITNNNTTRVVISEPPVKPVRTPPLNDYKNLSCFACLCCCWLIGIGALIKSSMARTLHKAGNYEGAKTAASSAKSLSMLAITVGVCIVVLCGIFIAAYYFN